MARFKEVELKRQGCVSLVSRMYSDDTLFDYVVGVPTVVKEWANKKIKVTKSKSRYVTNEEAYKLGNQHGLEYKVKRTDLLES